MKKEALKNNKNFKLFKINLKNWKISTKNNKIIKNYPTVNLVQPKIIEGNNPNLNCQNQRK